MSSHHWSVRVSTESENGVLFQKWNTKCGWTITQHHFQFPHHLQTRTAPAGLPTQLSSLLDSIWAWKVIKSYATAVKIIYILLQQSRKAELKFKDSLLEKLLDRLFNAALLPLSSRSTNSRERHDRWVRTGGGSLVAKSTSMQTLGQKKRRVCYLLNDLLQVQPATGIFKLCQESLAADSKTEEQIKNCKCDASFGSTYHLIVSDARMG